MERRLRTGEWVAVAALLVVMLGIAFWPSPVDATSHKGLDGILATLHGGGLPSWIDYDFVETAANVVFFLPLGGLIASVVMLQQWWVSGVLGLTLSLIVEFGQAEFRPERFASASDLMANTAGALVGGGIVALVRLRRARRRETERA